MRGRAHCTASMLLRSSRLNTELCPLNPTVKEALVTLTKGVWVKVAGVEGRGWSWEGGFIPKEKRGEMVGALFLR